MGATEVLPGLWLLRVGAEAIGPDHRDQEHGLHASDYCELTHDNSEGCRVLNLCFLRAANGFQFLKHLL